MKKKLLCMSLIIVMIVSLSACGKSPLAPETTLENQSTVVSEVENAESIEQMSTVMDETLSSEQTTEEVSETEEKEYQGLIFVSPSSDLEKIKQLKVMREATEYGLSESKFIYENADNIMMLFDDNEKAADAQELLENSDMTTSIIEIKGNFEKENLFRIARVFKLSGRGTVVAGYKSEAGVMKVGQTVCLIKKDGTTIKDTIKCIEKFAENLEETEPGEQIGIELETMEKDSIEAGDILVALATESEN